MSFVHPCNRERVCIFVCASNRKGGKLKQMQMLRSKRRHGVVFNHSGSMLLFPRGRKNHMSHSREYVSDKYIM